MPTCSSCRAEIPDSVTKCPKCFAPTGAVASALNINDAVILGAVIGGVICAVFVAAVLDWGALSIVGGFVAGAAIGSAAAWWLSTYAD